MMNVMHYRFSIVTASYNSAATISKTINSIKNQTFKNFEHIIIDGGSNDGTLDLLERWSKKSNVTLISEVDDGLYDAMNKGVQLARGTFVVFLNSDDVFSHKNVLENVHKCITSYPLAVFFYGDIVYLSDVGSICRVWAPSKTQKTGVFFEQVPHPSVFIETKLLKSLQPPFDTSYEISADLKQQLILLIKQQVVSKHLGDQIVNMSIGGKSTSNFSSYLKGWIEARRAYNEVIGYGGAFFVLIKVARKLSEHLKHVFGQRL